MLSTPLLLAASSSTTSVMESSSMPVQMSQTPQGWPSLTLGQLMAFARILEQVVLPVPREPVKR